MPSCHYGTFSLCIKNIASIYASACCLSRKCNMFCHKNVRTCDELLLESESRQEVLAIGWKLLARLSTCYMYRTRDCDHFGRHRLYIKCL